MRLDICEFVPAEFNTGQISQGQSDSEQEWERVWDEITGDIFGDSIPNWTNTRESSKQYNETEYFS